MVWSTLISDEGVFSCFLKDLGVESVQALEYLSLDAEQLQNAKPYGVIFLFNYTGCQDPVAPAKYDQEASVNMFFARQTIQNACASQAILSIVMNRSDIKIGPILTEFKDFTMELPPEMRGEALANSELIRRVHNSFSASMPFELAEDPLAPQEDVFHYISYVEVNDMLYELDSLQPAPINHGQCSKSKFASRVVEIISQRMKLFPENEIRFNMLAIVPERIACIKDDLALSESVKKELIAFEYQKRARWDYENALRRHNYIGLITELFKCLVEKKVQSSSFDSWILNAATRNSHS